MIVASPIFGAMALRRAETGLLSVVIGRGSLATVRRVGERLPAPRWAAAVLATGLSPMA